MDEEETQMVEIIERWERRDDGVTEISYSFDGGETFYTKGEVYELRTNPTN